MERNREEWLNKAITLLVPMIVKAGHEMPTNTRVSCGWPSRGALAKKKRTIGQCWDKAASKDSTWEIFISPYLHETPEVLSTLLHEMVHAAVGLECGHKGAFKTCAVAVGLEGKMTATVPGAELIEKLKALAVKLGAYPHAKLDGRKNNGPPKQGTRLIKCTCADCGMIIRTTQKWLDDTGLPICACGGEFSTEESE